MRKIFALLNFGKSSSKLHVNTLKIVFINIYNQKLSTS